MAYSDFTLRKVKDTFSLKLVETGSFLTGFAPVQPSDYLQQTLARNLAMAIAVGTEKARSELLISPILVEVRERLQRRVSLFSGTDFTVDASVGLNGICDFLLSQSQEQLLIEAPAVMIVEAKKEDLNPGLGQCIAELVAAQRFNQAHDRPIPAIYGAVTTGSLWRFLKLSGQTVEIDLADYAVPPVETVLGILLGIVGPSS
ncbi:hypothetical protein IQ260_02160 [Leptolyngbya cf. ectocarpi LEGE 11479]|uniref:Type I restriction enzyme R protein N-terminal domain-containing protein n=1 Tax=Leptolyngbya cf. ectocarpi LEGE 11479 TaxID=1828722 RepID=A0A928WY33_LEPEC|nr:hypothetical protein [Leptolyngbya ectocarpi]MBE9065452.1 hypothetical protein [Leptolyngbya cf. ectocarpi LEGE 11479]